MGNEAAPVVACVSLEPWDAVWRRNQHVASRLVEQGRVSRLVFVEPPVLGRPGAHTSPVAGVLTLRSPLLLPKRAGGLRLTAAMLWSGPLRDVNVLWVNDPQLGVHCLRPGVPTVYDVTDDWRTSPQPPHIVRRIIAAEDVLARRARTVVCSDVLAGRWRMRYGLDAEVVPNAVDLVAFATALPMQLAGSGPHHGYVGTLHSARLDVPLVLSLADATEGTVHLVGPDALDTSLRAALVAHPRILLHGAVPAAQVPAWMRAMDTLLCPHVVDDFTLSLDAIKSYEYLAAGRPVVATATSGFQTLVAGGLHVVERPRFVETVLAVKDVEPRTRTVVGWDQRAAQFADILLAR